MRVPMFFKNWIARALPLAGFDKAMPMNR